LCSSNLPSLYKCGLLGGLTYIMNLNEITTTFEYYKNISSEFLTLGTVLEFSISLLVIFAVRTVIWFNMSGSSLVPVKIRSKKGHYILGHVGIEILIANILAYLILSALGTDGYHLLRNLVIAPSLGAVCAIMLDHKLIMPIDGSSLTKPASDHTSSPDVNIVVNANGASESPSTPSVSTSSLSLLDDDRLSSDDVERPDFGEMIVEEINELKEVQQAHASSITVLQGTCSDIADTMEKIRSAQCANYGVVIKKRIYECLDKGYVTPQEWEEVETSYHIYHDILGGNGHIENLFIHKFMKIPIHEEGQEKETK